MENNIPTAEEFAKNNHPMKTYPVDWDVMIKFAKLHVQKALNKASKNSKSKEGQITDYKLTESILNSYSLDKIK